MSRTGTLRASDADRDQVVDRLHKAATEGRIAAEELEQRVTAALRARTYAELEATVADLPRSRPGSGSRARPAGGVQRRRTTGSWAISAIRANPFLILFAIPVVAVTLAMVLAATIVWAVLMTVVLVLGGRRHAPMPPWFRAGRRSFSPFR